MPSPSVAIIDIGSNSIKLLVAHRDDHGHLVGLRSHTVDARISAGISQVPPQLSESGMTVGIAAIESLLATAAPFSPARTVLVATSAVRDAENGDVFRRKVAERTGHEIRTLTGDEEAGLIGRGLTSDPALDGINDFYLFDLGGGSLECLTFRNRCGIAAISLPLGCVRMTERYVPDPTAPFGSVARHAVTEATREMLTRSGYVFGLPVPPTAVFAGGSMTTVRAIFAARNGQTLLEADPILRVSDIRALLDDVGALDLKSRQTVPGLPASRADVFPAALTTILAIADAGDITEYRHSLYNLRWGLAAEAL
ncbi:MAG: phosphatase [Opitutaceae bacterium]|nr:phosphatase [Opitutaceae bacterium]